MKALLNTSIFQIAGNKSKNLAVAQLYRKAAHFLQAAKSVFEVINIGNSFYSLSQLINFHYLANLKNPNEIFFF